MNGIDWIIIAILSFSGFISLLRGFVKEAISLVVWVSALLIAIAFSPKLAVHFADAVGSESLRMILSFVILFLATLIVGGLINVLLASLLKATGLTTLDRVLGMVFGVLRGGVMVLAVLIIVPPLVTVDNQLWWQQSTLIPQFLMLEDWALATFSDIAQWRAKLFNQVL